MKASIINFILATLMQLTASASDCAETQPSGTILETGIVEFDGNYDSVGGDLWYARPSGGTNKGVLRLANNSNERHIICVNNDDPEICFWVNAGDECTTRLGLTRVTGYSIFRA